MLLLFSELSICHHRMSQAPYSVERRKSKIVVLGIFDEGISPNGLHDLTTPSISDLAEGCSTQPDGIDVRRSS